MYYDWNNINNEIMNVIGTTADDHVNYEIMIKRCVHSQSKDMYAMFQHGLQSDYDDAGDLRHHHKSGKVELSHDILLALYIARDDVLYYSNMSTIDSWERTVHCLFCNSIATLKPTKTRRIMLRCNICGALVFANGILSQQRIQTLKDYRFMPLG